MRYHKLTLLTLIILLPAISLSACSGQSKATGLTMLPMDRMPAQVQSAAVNVQQAYQFASANTDVMKGIPCYCGCGNIGHISNYSCYVQGTDAKGNITFDNHALGCSLCVTITQDTMRFLKEGKTVPQIKAYVDAAYSKYGTSNMP